MKKIVFFLLLFVPFFTFADSQVEIHWPTQTYVSDDFDVQATLKSSENLDISSIDIGWKENFQLQGTSSQTQIQIINGKSQSQLLYTFSFVPVREGEFTLWPVTIKTSQRELKSNSLRVQVWISSWKASSKHNDDTLPNDIFPPQSPKFPFTQLFFFGWIFIFIVLFYLFLSKYLFTPVDTQKESNSIEPTKPVDLEERYRNYFHELLKNSERYNKNLFYHTMNELLRKYFEDKWLDSAQTLTFDEIKNTPFFRKNLSSFLSLFSQSYREEFIDGEDSFEAREKFISDILELLR